MWEKLDEKKSFCLPSENLVQILPESGSSLDPDPCSSKMPDPYPDPHITNADPKHCLVPYHNSGWTLLLLLVRSAVSTGAHAWNHHQREWEYSPTNASYWGTKFGLPLPRQNKGGEYSLITGTAWNVAMTKSSERMRNWEYSPINSCRGIEVQH
jgi:hypothetical protein